MLYNSLDFFLAKIKQLERENMLRAMYNMEETDERIGKTVMAGPAATILQFKLMKALDVPSKGGHLRSANEYPEKHEHGGRNGMILHGVKLAALWRAPRVGDKCGRQVQNHAAQSARSGRQVWETRVKSCGPRVRTCGLERPEWDKCGRQEGHKCQIMRPRAWNQAWETSGRHM